MKIENGEMHDVDRGKNEKRRKAGHAQIIICAMYSIQYSYYNKNPMKYHMIRHALGLLGAREKTSLTHDGSRVIVTDSETHLPQTLRNAAGK